MAYTGFRQGKNMVKELYQGGSIPNLEFHDRILINRFN